MKLMGASLAMAGLAGCTKQPDEPIYPYIKQPEDLLLGRPNYFATAFSGDIDYPYKRASMNQTTSHTGDPLVENVG